MTESISTDESLETEAHFSSGLEIDDFEEYQDWLRHRMSGVDEFASVAQEELARVTELSQEGDLRDFGYHHSLEVYADVAEGLLRIRLLLTLQLRELQSIDRHSGDFVELRQQMASLLASFRDAAVDFTEIDRHVDLEKAAELLGSDEVKEGQGKQIKRGGDEDDVEDEDDEEDGVEELRLFDLDSIAGAHEALESMGTDGDDLGDPDPFGDGFQEVN